MEKKYWIARTLGYMNDSEEVIQTTKEAGAKPVTLDLPKGFEDFKFFYINNGRGYFSIYEGTSGIAVDNDRKGLDFAKTISAEIIKRYAPTADKFKNTIISAQKSLIKRWKEQGKKLRSGYGIQFEEAKQEPKKAEPKKPKKTNAAKPKGIVLKAKKRQTGDSVEKSDKKRTALAAGKRKSASGNIYYEYRKNRTDIKKKI